MKNSSIDWEYDNGNLRIGNTLYTIREWKQYWHIGARTRLIQHGYGPNEIREAYDLIDSLSEQEYIQRAARRALDNDRLEDDICGYTVNILKDMKLL